MNVWIAWAAATLAALLGALLWYGVGATVGRARTRKIVGKVPLLDVEDFDRAVAFFARWGGLTVLIGRCVPLVRSFISIPAGIERMNLQKFCLYTLLGSGVWNGIWIGSGFAFGPAIRVTLERWSGLLSNVVLAVFILALAWFVVARLMKRWRARP